MSALCKDCGFSTRAIINRAGALIDECDNCERNVFRARNRLPLIRRELPKPAVTIEQSTAMMIERGKRSRVPLLLRHEQILEALCVGALSAKAVAAAVGRSHGATAADLVSLAAVGRVNRVKDPHDHNASAYLFEIAGPQRQSPTTIRDRAYLVIKRAGHPLGSGIIARQLGVETGRVVTALRPMVRSRLVKRRASRGRGGHKGTVYTYAMGLAA